MAEFDISEKMKTITLVAWNRPHYLQQVIGGLRKNDTSGYSLIGVLDYGYDKECRKLLESIDFMPTHVFELQKHWGAHHANKHAYQKALEFGSEKGKAKTPFATVVIIS